MKKKIDGQKVLFTFADGLDAVTFDATKVSAANRAYAEMHGWQARIGDNAALPRKDKDGNVLTVTEAMRRDAILELVTFYEAGGDKWTAGVTRTIAENPTWRAIADKRGVEYAVVAAEQAQKALDELAALG